MIEMKGWNELDAEKQKQAKLLLTILGIAIAVGVIYLIIRMVV